MNKNINEYHCQGCKLKTVTQNLYYGVTPFSLVCRKCNSNCFSVFFECDQKQKPDMFWFKPTSSAQLKKQVEWEIGWMDAAGILGIDDAITLQQEHINKGGLILAPCLEAIKEWENDLNVSTRK